MDLIKVSGIEFFAYHGVLDSEKNLGQIFSIDCGFEIDTSVCSDDIKKTVHYGELTLDIKKFCEDNKFELLESLVNHLSKFLLRKYTLIKRIHLTVNKPHAPIATKFSNVSVSITRERNISYLAIGSNLGDKEKYLDLVSEEILKNENIVELKKSSYIETEPYGVKDQPNFLNGVLKVETILTPSELLLFCKDIERKAGRKKN